MRIVKLKMIDDFASSYLTPVDLKWRLYKDKEYYAIDGEDYWLVQEDSSKPFVCVIPKTVKKLHHETVIYTTAEVVPTHTDQSPQQCPGCCPRT